MNKDQKIIAVMRFVRAALAQGHAISVWNRNCYTVRHATSADQIEMWLGTSNYDDIELFNPEFGGERRGFVMVDWTGGCNRLFVTTSENDATDRVIAAMELKAA